MKVTGIKTLILETDEEAASGLEKICKHFDASFIIAGSLAQFRVEVPRFRPQMVLIGDGCGMKEALKLVEDLRNYSSTRFIPIFALVGRNQPKVATAFLEAGADDFFERPLDYKSLHFRFYSCLFHAAKVNQLRKMLHELKMRSDSVHAANEAKTRFLANMSHDIRTPISGVIGMTGFLMETELRSEQRNFVETIRSSGEVALSILEDILDFSKMESGKLELYVSPMSLTTCFEEALDANLSRATEKDINVSLELEDGVKETIVADNKRLRQILTNLLGNAIKFTSHGDVFVQIRKTGAHGNRSLYRFSVTDTGIGIPEDKLQNLFEYFRQASVFINNFYGGYGLGLAISKGLVNLMNGSIWVESKLGQGATFSFEIPVDECQTDQVDSPRILMRMVSGLRGKRVIMSDTFKPKRQNLIQMLTAWGMECTRVESLEEAIRELRHSDRPYDFVLIHSLDQSQQLDGAIREICDDIRDRSLVTRVLASIPYQNTWQKTREHENQPVSWIPRPMKYSVLRQTFIESLTRPVTRKDPEAQQMIQSAGILASRPEADRVKAATKPVSQVTEAVPVRKLSDDLPLNILIVDDNHINLKVAGQLIKQLGYEHFEIAENGQEAIDKCLEKDFDFILMDVQMPIVDGLEATRRIRENETRDGRRPACIVAMTANVMADDRSNCLSAGMNEYLSKPIRNNSLRQTIEKLFKASDFKESHKTSGTPQSTPVSGVRGGGTSLLKDFGGLISEFDKPLEETNAIDAVDRSYSLSRAAIQHPVVDLAHLEEISGHDKNIMRDIASQYLKDASERVRQLTSAIKIDDFEKARRICHNFAGASATCGVINVEKLLRSVESMCQKRHLPNRDQVFKSLEDEVNRVGSFFTENNFFD